MAFLVGVAVSYERGTPVLTARELEELGFGAEGGENLPKKRPEASSSSLARSPHWARAHPIHPL